MFRTCACARTKKLHIFNFCPENAAQFVENQVHVFRSFLSTSRQWANILHSLCTGFPRLFSSPYFLYIRQNHALMCRIFWPLSFSFQRSHLGCPICFDFRLHSHALPDVSVVLRRLCPRAQRFRSLSPLSTAVGRIC